MIYDLVALSIESAGLSIESVPFYRMAGFLGIPRKRSAFYRKCKFLENAEHIHVHLIGHNHLYKNHSDMLVGIDLFNQCYYVRIAVKNVSP